MNLKVYTYLIYEDIHESKYNLKIEIGLKN